MEKYTQVDFKDHKLITSFSDDFKMWKLKKPNTITQSIAFINTHGILLVTGDYGDFTFCREFHPTSNGFVEPAYWCEKYRISTQQKSHEYSVEKTRKMLQEGIEYELEEYGYDENELNIMKKYYHQLLSVVELSEWEYISYAYDQYIPTFITAEDVPFCKEIRHCLLIVFDAFNEICQRLK